MSTKTPRISGQQRIQFSGPFYTDFKIPTFELLSEGYNEAQTRVHETIVNSERQLAEGWVIEGKVQRTAQKRFWGAYGDYAGKPIVSLSFLLKALPKSQHKAIKIGSHHFLPERVLLYFHEYGTGIITFDGTIQVDGILTFEEYCHVLDELAEQLCNRYQETVANHCQFLKSILQKSDILVSKPFQHSGKLEEQLNALVPTEQILWLHHVCIFSITGSMSRERVEPYTVFLQTTKAGLPKNLSPTPDLEYYAPGWIKSLIVYGEGAERKFNFLRILALAQYHWASMALMDYVLLSEQNQFAVRTKQHRDIRQMKRDIRFLKQLDDEIYMFLKLMKNKILNLSAEGIRLYEGFVEIGKQDELGRDLKDNVARLQRIYGEYIDYLKEHRSITLERFIKIFTLLSIVPIIFELVRFIQAGSGLLGTELLFNILTVLTVSSTISAIILVILYIMERREI
ncbi:MAG: hypothetical protein ACFFCO_08275 [Promethearchaeota archaeon]